MNGRNRSVAERFLDDELILEAMRQAYNVAVREHRAAGVPMVFWENGKVVEIPADQVQLAEPRPRPPRS